MRILLKIVLAPILLLLACLIAGLYGMLHNQISCTVSPEYFTEYKFKQFHIRDAVEPRLGAAIVGWHASWWMGLVIGGILVPLGLILRAPRAYFLGTLYAFGAVVATAMVIGLLGLSVATMQNDSRSIPDRSSVQDPAAFRRAGEMHNAAYLGGLLGIGSGSIVIAFRRMKEVGGPAVRAKGAPRVEAEARS